MTKTILITGASSGIGKASVDHFAANGWNVVATMRDPAKGAATARENILVTRLDVQDRPSIDAAIAATLDRFGAIDVLLNNAGYSQSGIFEATPREKIIEQFDINVFGVMDVTRAALPAMRAARAGTIINVSSGAGIFTLPSISLYCASKFALEGFSEALSYELLALGINVKLVIPHGGVTETNFGAHTVAAAPPPAPADYDDFRQRSAAAFARMTAARQINAGDVAQVVWQAATDGTDRLRYLVGNDTRGFIKARAELADDDYVAFMRTHFRDALGRAAPAGSP
jgi:NAD(P)-dependent dehydrogenase (short-subunit alcohol dehydrogenase family)